MFKIFISVEEKVKNPAEVFNRKQAAEGEESKDNNPSAHVHQAINIHQTRP